MEKLEICDKTESLDLDFKFSSGVCILHCNVFFQDTEIKINPVNIFPISLLLIDDILNANKIKGLTSCYAIMQCLVCT